MNLASVGPQSFAGDGLFEDAASQISKIAALRANVDAWDVTSDVSIRRAAVFRWRRFV